MQSSSSCPRSRSTAGRRPGVGFDLHLEILKARPGHAILRVTGRDARRVFERERGGHRWQRVPPTERRGRVHTSTITVAALPEVLASEFVLDPSEVQIRTTGSGGPGGQHANKTESTVVATHLPTGTTVRIESRSQHQNRAVALSVLRTRLATAQRERNARVRNRARREQVGSGMRGDKSVTISIPRDSVIHHETGKRTTYRRYSRGYLDDLL
ncbi:MAG TPA: PCRF domain-containing protein [Deltaproteobacteria bacterium]|nr:PCRF domain-containing protein [Deltaproteobacteria bacterium]